jgi:UPF0716 family protein affecting phage T7 exclusion
VELFQGVTADVVDDASMSMYSVTSSVAAMQNAEAIGKKYEDEEALQIVLLFVGAILMLLPGTGE